MSDAWICGIGNHVPCDVETANSLAAQLPELLYCCYSAAMETTAVDAITSCTCWEPVYDLEQQDPLTEMLAGSRTEQCEDCAYRHDSPESAGDPRALQRAVDEGMFWCHHGMRKPKLWRHPCGAELPGDPADYSPPIIDGIPFKANGMPADVCAGWKARQSPVTWSEVRKGIDQLSTQREEWEGIPIPLSGMRLRLRPGHVMTEAAERFDLQASGVEIEFHCGPNEVREDEVIRNVFYSRRAQANIYLYQQGEKVFHARKLLSPDRSMERLNLWLNTLGASDAWEEEAEQKAREKLRGMISARQWRHYDLTGMFLENSPRSQLTYLFRRLRPTVVLSPRHKAGSMTDSMLCIAVLCMHSIGYYDNSWAGCLTPTDDVIAHLISMRGDEARWWGNCTQHAPWHPEAGL